jgi:hypothetical protein
MTMPSQNRKIPSTPKPSNHAKKWESPGHCQYLPVLMIRAVVERAKVTIKIKITIGRYFSIGNCCINLYLIYNGKVYKSEQT